MPKDVSTPAELGPGTRSELVRILRDAPTTVDAWKRSGCPVDMSAKPYRYPVHEIVDWLCERREAKALAEALDAARAGLPAADDPVALDAYRKRRARAETELL